MTTDLRAVVLAAGHGRRLRPLTETTPKPLLPAFGKPIILHTLEQLARAGIERVAINLHHAAEAIPETLGLRPAGLDVTYSHEPEILGTLGALAPLASFVEGADALVVINGDSFCRWPIKRLLRRHLASGAPSTLLLLTKVAPESYGGGVGLGERRDVVSLRPGRSAGTVTRRQVYSGAQIVDPSALPELPPGRLDFVTDLWEPWLRTGRSIAALSTGRPWHDLGTPRRYLEGLVDSIPWWRRNWIHPDLAGPRRRWRRVVAEDGVEWEEKTRLRDSVLLPGARIGRGCSLERVVVGPGTEVPPGTSINDRLLTRPRVGVDPPPGTSRLGELWISPIEPEVRSGRP